MTVVWIVIGVAVLIGGTLTVLEVQNLRRRRVLAHLGPVDPRVGEHAMADAESAHAITEGLARSAHPGPGGVGGTLGGS
jgi:hypothetical protein